MIGKRWRGLAWMLMLLTCPQARGQILDIFDGDPAKFDMMVVVAHPDDEGTFGGLLPHYAVCRGKSIKFVSMTSGEWGQGMPHHTSADQKPDYSYDQSDHQRYEEVPEDALYPSYFREVEMSRTLDRSGVRYAPLMPRYKDASNLQPWGKPDAAFELWGGRDTVVEWLATQIRQFQPDVIVTMAEDGFNRNPQHMAASRAARLAVPVAADASRSNVPGQAWQVAKLYTVVTTMDDPVPGANPDDSLIQGIEDQLHVHRWDQPCEALSATPQIRAAEANALHKSQGMKATCAAENRFILQHSTVGPDRQRRDDLFENL